MSPHKASYEFNVDLDQHDAADAMYRSTNSESRHRWDGTYDDGYQYQHQQAQLDRTNHAPSQHHLPRAHYRYSTNNQTTPPPRHQPQPQLQRYQYDSYGQIDDRNDQTENVPTNNHDNNDNHNNNPLPTSTTRWAPIPSLTTPTQLRHSSPRRHGNSFTHQPSPTVPQSRHHSTQPSQFHHSQQPHTALPSPPGSTVPPTPITTNSAMQSPHSPQQQQQGQYASPQPPMSPASASASASLTIVSVDGIKPGIVLANPVTCPIVVSLCSTAAAAGAAVFDPKGPQVVPMSPIISAAASTTTTTATTAPSANKTFDDLVHTTRPRQVPFPHHNDQFSSLNPTTVTASNMAAPTSPTITAAVTSSRTPASQAIPTNTQTAPTMPPPQHQPINLNTPNPFQVGSRPARPQFIPTNAPNTLQTMTNSAAAASSSSSSSVARHNPFPSANLKVSLRPFDNISLNTYYSRNLDPVRSIQRKLFFYTQPALTHHDYCQALVSIILVETPTAELAKLTPQEEAAIFPNQRRYSMVKTADPSPGLSSGSQASNGSQYQTSSSQPQSQSQTQSQSQERIHFGICPCLVNNPKIEFRVLPTPTSQSSSSRIPPSPNPLDPNQTASVFYISCVMLLSDLYPDLSVTNQCTSFMSPHRRLVSFAHNLVHDPLSLAGAMMRAIQSRSNTKINLQVHIDELLPNTP